MRVTPNRVEAGQSIYTKQILTAYDFVVLGVSNRFFWQCPTQRLVAHYNQNLSENHLDVGVGTGYFLDRCQFPSSTPRIALMDLNSNALEFAARRIMRYNPQTYQRNVLDPIALDAEAFDSVGINYLLHCLPGSIESPVNLRKMKMPAGDRWSKSVVFTHLKALMNPNAIIFGSTLLQEGVRRNWFAKRLMDIYNKKGIFSNQQDNLEGLQRSLNQHFREVSVEVVGCVALFSGRV